MPKKPPVEKIPLNWNYIFQQYVFGLKTFAELAKHFGITPSTKGYSEFMHEFNTRLFDGKNILHHRRQYVNQLKHDACSGMRETVQEACNIMLGNQIKMQMEATQHIANYMNPTLGSDEKNSQASKFYGDSSKMIVDLLKLLAVPDTKGSDANQDESNNDISLTINVKDVGLATNE